MEPQDVEFESALSSPDNEDIPVIPAVNESNQHSLDFEHTPPPATKQSRVCKADKIYDFLLCCIWEDFSCTGSVRDYSNPWFDARSFIA